MVVCAARCGAVRCGPPPPPPPPPGLLSVCAVCRLCVITGVCASVPGQLARLQSHSQALKPRRATQLLRGTQTQIEQKGKLEMVV